MRSPSSEVRVSGPSVMTKITARPAIGAHSRLVRFVIVTLAVALYIVLGFVLHLSQPEYQLLGIPLLLIFQLGIHRQPLRTLWVRAGPSPRLDKGFIILWILFSVFPAYAVVREAIHLQLAHAAEFSMALVGAFGLAYAVRAMRAETWRQLILCVLTVGIIGLLPQVLSLLLPHILHIHTAHPVTTTTRTLPQSLSIALEWLLIAPVGFVVEEVFFRGALDTYLHHGEAGTGWLSAVYISALWGLWHLPGQTISQGQVFSAIVGLLIAEIAVGVPLSLGWRKSGNLVTNNSAHALLEAVRNALVGAGLF